MYAAWFGGTGALTSNVNGTANFMHISSGLSGGTSTTNNTRQGPCGEAVTITNLFVYCDVNPSPGNLTFAVDIAGSASAATCNIPAGSTSAFFSGAVTVTQDQLLSMRITPAASAAVQGRISWVIIYRTAGDFFLMMGGSGTAYSNAATQYHNPVGYHNTTNGTTELIRCHLAPGAGTATRLSVATPVGNVGGTNYAMSIRLNGVDSLTATIGSGAAAANASGSVAITAGHKMTMKGVPTGTPTARNINWCTTIAPTVRGTVWNGYGTDNNASAWPADNTSRYSQMQGCGFPDASGGVVLANEATRGNILRLGFILHSLYLETTTAPGAGKTRTLTLRDNGASTALTVPIADAAVSGSDTTNRVSMSAAPNWTTFEWAATGTPAASAAMRVGYAIEVPQIYGQPWKNKRNASIGALLCDL